MPQFEALVGVNFWTALFVLLNTLAIFFVAKKYLTEPGTGFRNTFSRLPLSLPRHS